MINQTSHQLNFQMCPAPNDQGHTELHDAISPDIAPEEETELSSAMHFEAMPADFPNETDIESADEFNGLDEDSRLRKWPVAPKRLFRTSPNSSGWRPEVNPVPTFDTLDYRSEADKFEELGDGNTYLCFALIEPRYEGDEVYRMLMVHPEHIEWRDAAFRIFTKNDDELEVHYTRAAKYIALHAQDGTSVSVWLKWDGSLIEANRNANSNVANGNVTSSAPRLALKLAQWLCCLELLTPEVEQALQVSIPKKEKNKLRSKFKRRR